MTRHVPLVKSRLLDDRHHVDSTLNPRAAYRKRFMQFDNLEGGRVGLAHVIGLDSACGLHILGKAA